MPEAAQLVTHTLIGRLRGEDPHRTSTLRSLSATAVGHSIQAETIALAGLNARQFSAPSTQHHHPPTTHAVCPLPGPVPSPDEIVAVSPLTHTATTGPSQGGPRLRP
ncbi:hypothetical protein HBH56_223230 [Parastagonospora nodorum]|uniref:Uncharacterized protein n=1 Tax=Phaeosphaeria nodorum (strain SN15 / ATCC MYA-4574 / FGSC 10173) TaxID=321614 RepID=A0A7U2I737_PHANO|nr:hypothetical protein HBH56_223230 [Parastagonospora nodorum]QRD04385.1 hypothetical protein JI435_443410 [Parastagonospora nodorum SN15]KAH3921886.1 hypothetical protein HBH54_231380 [Parastagonospora nodorum]KAH3939391.1 hypothetical protein HBH53_235410 [Parastagonospora nodorum]KAH3957219.1 hypothetical protein HBH51_228780 [Parastagonospora nodorum]